MEKFPNHALALQRLKSLIIENQLIDNEENIIAEFKSFIILKAAEVNDPSLKFILLEIIVSINAEFNIKMN